jgi:hypothetical protein
MLPRLGVEPGLSLAKMTERSPCMRSAARDDAVPEVFRRDFTVARRAIELLCRFVVQPRGGFEPLAHSWHKSRNVSGRWRTE